MAQQMKGVFCAVRAEMWKVGSRSTGTIQEHRGRGMYAVGSSYQRTGEDKKTEKTYMCASVNCRVRGTVTAQSLFIVMFCKCPINPITNGTTVQVYIMYQQLHK
jgi:hypothetical protein